MKKSKKLLNKKPTVIFIYGPIAAGKLTVAKILSKKLGYKLAHNHHVNDFVDEIFDFGSIESQHMKEELRTILMRNMAQAQISFVTTYCYAHNFVSKTGHTDPKYLEHTEKMLKKLGAHFYPVHLQADPRELLRRVNMNSRKKFKKLVDKNIMKEWIQRSDFKTSPKLKNNLIIDNTHVSAQKTADMIIRHFKLK